MLQDAFLERISQQLYPQRTETYEKLCFSLRWHPRNYTQKQRFIAQQIAKQLNMNIESKSFQNLSSGLSLFIARAADKIWKNFQEEMIADGFTVETTGQRGQPRNEDQSPYRVTYKWLWEKKFPRMAWELLKEVAEPLEDKIKMIPYDEIDRIIEDYIPEEETLQKNTKYRLKMNLDATGYLLLINETADGRKYLISPSKSFAEIPFYPLSQPLYLPPDNKEHRAFFGFDTEKELFLAIITKQQINLSWINENYSKKDIKLNEHRLLEIFQEIGKLSDCQVFQRNFRVK